MPPQKKNKKGSHRSDSSRRQAIVVLGGSFAPLHAGHLAALECGRKNAEQSGYHVVAGYLAVAHDGHLRGKLRTRGEDASQALTGDVRLRLCNEVAETSSWLQPTPCTYGSAKQCGQAMVSAFHAPSTHIAVVRGSDLPALSKSGQQELSSTYVRQQVRAGGVDAVRRLAKERVLPAAVASHLEQVLLTPTAETSPQHNRKQKRGQQEPLQQEPSEQAAQKPEEQTPCTHPVEQMSAGPSEQPMTLRLTSSEQPLAMQQGKKPPTCNHIQKHKTGPFVIGISGCTRAGKGTLAAALVEELGSKVTQVVGCDKFFLGKPKARSPPEARMKRAQGAHAQGTQGSQGAQGWGWDSTDSIDHAAVRRTVAELVRRRDLEVVIVEGFRAFHDPALVGMMDQLLWLEVSREACAERKRRFTPQVWEAHLEYKQQCFGAGGAMANDNRVRVVLNAEQPPPAVLADALEALRARLPRSIVLTTPVHANTEMPSLVSQLSLHYGVGASCFQEDELVEWQGFGEESKAAVQAKDWAAAAELFEKAIQLRPNWPKGYVCRARCLEKLGEPAAAAALCQVGIDHSHPTATAGIRELQALLQQLQLKEASPNSSPTKAMPVGIACAKQ